MAKQLTLDEFPEKANSIISDNQAETGLIITINASIGDLPLIMTISDV